MTNVPYGVHQRKRLDYGWYHRDAMVSSAGRGSPAHSWWFRTEMRKRARVGATRLRPGAKRESGFGREDAAGARGGVGPFRPYVGISCGLPVRTLRRVSARFMRAFSICRRPFATLSYLLTR